MAIQIDWADFRDHVATLKAWIRKWDDLFVIEKPERDADAECRRAYFRHEATIKRLRAHIRQSHLRCEALMAHAGATSEVFGHGRPVDFVRDLSREHQQKARSLLAGYRAVYHADWLVRKSTRAGNYTYYSWEQLHAKKETQKAFIACRESVEFSSWVLLSDIQDPVERACRAREDADTMEVDLPPIDADPANPVHKPPRKRKDSPAPELIAAVKTLREQGFTRSEIPAELRMRHSDLVPADSRDDWPSERTQRLWEKQLTDVDTDR